MEQKHAQNLIDFIYKSPTAFQVTENIKEILNNYGFEMLSEKDSWNLKQGSKYYITRNDSSIIAFTLGNNIPKNGFKIIASHTDSPSFLIKPNPIINVENSYIKLNTETYGGVILSTWFDRPLSIAGRIILKDNYLKPKSMVFNINKPILVIPNLAVHMNKDINIGYKYNKQKDMLPLLCLINKEINSDNYLVDFISDELKININNIIDLEMFLYEYDKGGIIGLNNEFISSSRLDDLMMVYNSLKAFIQSNNKYSTNVLACVDNEEIGSLTAQGANSSYLNTILKRIAISSQCTEEDFYRGISSSIMISADLSHGVHPNYIDKYDPKNRPILGKGPTIKFSANQKYSTTRYSSSIFCNICEHIKIPYQKFVSRSDMSEGSTIGPILASKLGIPTVDIGASILAMHSIRELGSVKDNYYCFQAFKHFYELNDN